MIHPVLAAAGSGVVLLELGGLILVLATLARLAHRAKLSSVPLYLLAGLALGEGGVFGLSASDGFLEVGATIGVVLLLLLLGLEYTSDELVENLRSNAPAGAVDLLNAAPGVALALVAGWGWYAAAAMGGITYVSSSGVIAKVLDDLGRVGNRETPTILSLLVLEDLVMAVYLPILVGLGVGGGGAATGRSVAVAVAAVAIALFGALRFSAPISRLVFSSSEEILLFGILGTGLAVAGLAEQLNVSGAVGAFLVGIAISGPAAHHAGPLLRPLRDLFAAAFFIFFAFQIDPSELPDVLGLAAALAVVSGAAKVATTWWAAARAGIGPRGRLRAGAAMTTRGEFSIVIAGIAVTNGVDTEVGAVAAAYVLILAAAGPMLARFAEPVVERVAPGVFDPA